MKIRVINTPHGLVPMYDSDFDEKRKLKQGAIYTAEIRIPRNLDFHRKAFALVNAGYAFLPERTQNGFRSVDGFRKYATVAAGYYDLYYNPRLKDWVEVPKSWSFGSMDNAEFGEFYERLKDVILGLVGRYVSEEEFMNNLANF
jgi:hypothetical protein